VRLSAVGDVLHALPVLSALRQIHPDARIDWVVEDRAAGLLTERKDLDRVVVLPRGALRAARGRPFRLARSARGFLRDLRSVRYDAAIDLQGNLKSGVVLRASGARLRFGMDRATGKEGNHLFSTRRTHPPRRARHRVERNLAVLAAFLGRPVPYVPPGFPTSPEEIAAAEVALAEAGVLGRPFAALHPGTSGFGSFKRWPAERFADLARRLRASGTAVVVTHAPAERTLAERVVETAGEGARRIESPGFGFLAEVLRRATLFVAADTGPLHLAALLGTPVLGLFGPKDPAVYGPYGLRDDGTPGLLPFHVRTDVACRPCTLRRCPDPVCMNGMEPATVFSRATGRGPI
jgi:heptosyltransferase-1